MTEPLDDILRGLAEAPQPDRKDLLEQLFERFGPQFRRIAADLIRREADADLSPDELLNEFFLRFIRDIRPLQGAPSVSAFWASVKWSMRRILIDGARRAGAPARPAERQPRKLRPLASSPESHYQIEEAIERLPDQQRDIAEYIALSGLTSHESARLLDLSYHDADRIWKTARKNLKALLGRSDAEPGVDPEHLLPTPPWRRHYWCEWRLNLDGSLDHVTRDFLFEITQELRKHTLDETLEVVRIRNGSIVLFLDGSREGYEIISSLVRSGQVKEVLGRRIEDVKLLEIGSARSLLIGEGKSWCGLFMSYAHADARLQQQLRNHLVALEREGLVTAWYDRKIRPGGVWREEIRQQLEASNIVLLLISASFVASEYCYGVELKRAMERHEARNATVLPILLRPVAWENLSFGRLQALPRNGKPVSRWADRDEAYKHITEEIRTVAKYHRGAAAD